MEDKHYELWKLKQVEERNNQSKHYAYNELMFRLVREENIKKLQGNSKQEQPTSTQSEKASN